MENEAFYVSYKLDDDREAVAKFANVNDRDGCWISLDMYKMNLGPISEAVWKQIVGKFSGTVLS